MEGVKMSCKCDTINIVNDNNVVIVSHADGRDGKSAYEQAVEGGYTGTEQEFNCSLSLLAEPRKYRLRQLKRLDTNNIKKSKYMAQLQKAPQGMWFYKDTNRREFTDLVALGVNDTPYELCTEEEKQEWINSHKEDYPELFEVNEQV